MQNDEKEIIGRLEYVGLPDFGLQKIVAKIDTGAYTGAIHASNIREIELSGQKMIEFNLLDNDYNGFIDRVHTVSDYEIKKVKSSTGEIEFRYTIPVRLLLKNKVLNTKLSLSDRKEMRYPILLGRKFIKNLFLVDVSKKFTN